MRKYWFATTFLMIISIVGAAQEAEKKETKEEEALKGTHRFTLVLGHTLLSEGIGESGKRGWITVPSWGFDYDYWISNHWAIGLQNDMVIENFLVEKPDNTVIERSSPLTSVAAMIFKPKKHISFITGIGGEFSKEENFVLTRLGIESGWEMKKNWEFGISFLYDIKWSGYNTLVFGFGISKLLKKNSR